MGQQLKLSSAEQFCWSHLQSLIWLQSFGSLTGAGWTNMVLYMYLVVGAGCQLNLLPSIWVFNPVRGYTGLLYMEISEQQEDNKLPSCTISPPLHSFGQSKSQYHHRFQGWRNKLYLLITGAAKKLVVIFFITLPFVNFTCS